MRKIKFDETEKEIFRKCGVDVSDNVKRVLLRSNNQENIYGEKVKFHTEYDEQPEEDLVFGGISRRVAILLKDGRVLHECFYVAKEDEWYYLGKMIRKDCIVLWWYEEDRLYEI